MTTSVPLEVAPSAFSGLIGLARRDTTPPEGIYARMWGAATHDFADGVHRPLTATALALQSDGGGRPRLLVALDIALLGDLGGTSDAERVLAPVREALGARARRAARQLLAHARRAVGGDEPEPQSRWRADRPLPRPVEPGDPGGGPGGDRAARSRDADLGDRPLRPRPQPRSPRPGERGRPHRVRLQPRRERGRHARRRPDHGGRRRPRARHGRQLRLPPDHAGVGQHADLAGLHRSDARARRGEHRGCTVRLSPGRLRRARPGPPVRRRSGGRRPAWAPSRLQRARRARGDAPRRAGAPLRRPRRVRRAARRLAAGAVRAVARPRRRPRRRAAPGQAHALGRGARGAAGGDRGQGDRRAAVPQDPDRAQPERRWPPGLPRLGLARRRQPPRRPRERGVLVLPGGAPRGVPRRDRRRDEHERSRDGLPLSARARRSRPLPGLADAVREGGTADADRGVHRRGSAAVRLEPELGRSADDAARPRTRRGAVLPGTRRRSPRRRRRRPALGTDPRTWPCRRSAPGRAGRGRPACPARSGPGRRGRAGRPRAP